jgi:hypothetical protein
MSRLSRDTKEVKESSTVASEVGVQALVDCRVGHRTGAVS